MTSVSRRKIPLIASLALALVASALPAAAFAPAASAATASPEKVVLKAVDTAWATNRYPSTVQKHDYLSATRSADTTFLKFSGAALKGKDVKSASLELKVRSTTATKPGLVAYKTSSNWSAGTLTFNNKPAAGGVASGQSATVVAGQVVRVPLNVDAIPTTGNFSFSLKYAQAGIRLQMERSGAYAAKIVVTTANEAVATEDRPQAPSPKPSGSPRVFAHYFVPYPLSLDNKAPESDYYARNYLSPSGENGKFSEQGGLLRDRPLSPAPQSASDWRVRNMATEVRQAKAAGIDGWMLNLMSSSGQGWEAGINVMKASASVGDFVVVPMVDGSSGFVKNTPTQAASLLNQLYRSGPAYKINGSYLLSSFKAEGASVSWWSQVISILEKTHGLPITFQAVFLNASDDNMKAFAPIADGYGNWGSRTERNSLARPNYDARAASYGKTWMEPIAVQDVRFNASRWAESNNTAAVRAQWKRAIEENVDYVQLVTWNDYSESTQIAPSQAHGDSFLDLTRYYTTWFETGKAPAVASDEILLTHRTQFVNAKPTFSHKLMGAPTLDGTSTPARDTVEAVVWMKAAGTVRITVGGKTTTVSAPAGMSAHTVALGLGTVSASIERSGSVTAKLTSPYKVVSTPKVQDLQYYAASTW
ncbi:endo-1,3-alpha-glucanase family glycosylhydrolase [Microbacterium sp. USHLN186]|uniref:endo-1,3-alpha-glucanase family glycosylhydrolase n=1 Tax=Microbacterium sp. USHLN186 TaxID=3081286 RepID=UPI00301B004F